ncbi:MAG: cupin domain-containing protein [Phycisphaerae bacterium]|nr:cupin domain-containing protein [Phycisphaerae bacterium]
MASGRPIVIRDLFNLPNRISELSWEPFRAGVKIHRIYGEPSTGPWAALLLYEKGTTLPRHLHQGFEHILVLSNRQRDEKGEYDAGTLVINPPGSSHEVTIPEASVVLAIWERPVIWDDLNFADVAAE